MRGHAKDWQVAVAAVTDESSNWREGFVSYEYSVDGRQLSGRARSCWNDFLISKPCNSSENLIAKGESVAIRYNPQNPEESTLEMNVQAAAGTSLLIRLLLILSPLTFVPMGLIFFKKRAR